MEHYIRTVVANTGTHRIVIARYNLRRAGIRGRLRYMLYEARVRPALPAKILQAKCLDAEHQS